MPMLTLYPTSETSPNNWVLAAGASKVAAVASNDGLTSYIHSTNTNNTFQAFNIDTTGILGPTDTINSIDIEAYVAPNTNNSSNLSLQYSYDIAGGGSQSATSPPYPSSDVMNSFNWFTFSESNLNHLFGGNLKIQINKLAGTRLNCTILYCEIWYTPATPPSTQPPRTMHQFAQRRVRR